MPKPETTTRLQRRDIDELRRACGEVILPTDAAYDETRRLWNAIHDRRPAVIVRPTSAPQVAAAVQFAREHELEIVVQSGGHSARDLRGQDGCLLINLSAMRGVEVDPQRRTARTNGGALLGELDVAAQQHGLVCPTGVVGHTGVGGLTLGGGVGRLQRNFGLTIDNLRAVELVTVDGRVVRASADEEPELFWGMRGAGANFGVVTSLELDLHPFDGTLHRGVHIHPATDVHELWATFRDFAAAAPETISMIFTLAHADTSATYPDSVAGKPIVVVSYNHSGAAEDVERDIAPLLAGPKPASVTAVSEPYTKAQRSSDLSLAWGSRTVIHGGSLADCAPAILDGFVAQVEQVPGDSSISITALGGAIARVDDDAMAFTGRTAPFDVAPDTAWSDPALDEANIEWVRSAMAIVEPHLLPGRYINELSWAGPDVTRSAYGDAKVERLRALKRAWDPENLLRLNHNIAP